MDTKEKSKRIKEIAKGTSQSKIGKMFGISQPAVAKFKRNNIEAIEKETEKLLTLLPCITEQLTRDLQTSNKVSKAMAGEKVELSPEVQANLGKFMELSWKKQSDLLRTIGIFPSTAPSTVIQNLFQDGSKAVISPNILNILGSHMNEMFNDDN